MTYPEWRKQQQIRRGIFGGLATAVLVAVVIVISSFVEEREAKAQHAILAAQLAERMVAATGPLNSCVSKPLAVDALALTASRAFIMNAPDFSQGYGLATVFIAFTDANNSVTRVDLTCTGSNNGSTSDYVPQVCDDTSDGICVQTPAGVWRKTTTGTMLWETKINIEGDPSVECTVSSGVGTPASIDLLTVGYTLCVKG